MVKDGLKELALQNGDFIVNQIVSDIKTACYISVAWGLLSLNGVTKGFCHLSRKKKRKEEKSFKFVFTFEPGTF